MPSNSRSNQLSKRASSPSDAQRNALMAVCHKLNKGYCQPEPAVKTNQFSYFKSSNDLGENTYSTTELSPLNIDQETDTIVKERPSMKRRAQPSSFSENERTENTKIVKEEDSFPSLSSESSVGNHLLYEHSSSNIQIVTPLYIDVETDTVISQPTWEFKRVTAVPRFDDHKTYLRKANGRRLRRPLQRQTVSAGNTSSPNCKFDLPDCSFSTGSNDASRTVQAKARLS